MGVNSEMDALPGVGHACGHNLVGPGCLSFFFFYCNKKKNTVTVVAVVAAVIAIDQRI